MEREVTNHRDIDGPNRLQEATDIFETDLLPGCLEIRATSASGPLEVKSILACNFIVSPVPEQWRLIPFQWVEGIRSMTKSVLGGKKSNGVPG